MFLLVSLDSRVQHLHVIGDLTDQIRRFLIPISVGYATALGASSSLRITAIGVCKARIYYTICRILLADLGLAAILHVLEIVIESTLSYLLMGLAVAGPILTIQITQVVGAFI